MKEETTIEDYIDYFIKSVCSKCNYYNNTMGVCGGEILPIERAILRNLEGRGICREVKEFAELLKEQENE